MQLKIFLISSGGGGGGQTKIIKVIEEQGN